MTDERTVGLAASRDGDTHQFLARWASEVRHGTDVHRDALPDIARALVDVGAVEADTAEELVAAALRWRARPAPRESPEVPFLGCVRIGQPLGGGFPPTLHALALEVLRDGLVLSVAGVPGGRGTSTAELQRLWNRLQTLRATDDIGTVYEPGPSPDGGCLSRHWIEGSVGLVPAPPPGASTLSIHSASEHPGVEIDLRQATVLSAAAVRRRRLTPQAAISAHRIEWIATQEWVTGHGAHPLQPREIDGRVLLVAEHLVEAGVLSPDDPLLAELRLGGGRPSVRVGRKRLATVREVPPVTADAARWLRRVMPLAMDLGTLDGRRIVLRWVAVWSDMLRLTVSIHHGNPDGHDSGVNRPRFRVADRWSWRHAALSFNDWCGRPWTTYMLSVRAPLDWRGRRLTLSADAGGEELSVTLEAGPGTRGVSHNS